MYDQPTEGMATTRHRSLVVKGGRKGFATVRDKGLVTKKCQHTEISNLIKKFKQIELPAKLLDYFL